MVSNTKRRIVITAMGLVSPIGLGRDAVLESLQAGRSGVRPIQRYNGAATVGGIGGEVADLGDENAKKICFTEKEEKKAVKLMCRDVLLGTCAAKFALGDSGLDLDAIDHTRIGVEYGANLMFFEPENMAGAARASSNESGDFQLENWGTAGLRGMEPLWMLKYLPNMPACHIAIFFQALGPNNSVTVDEASTGAALTEALNILERGAADMMLVGATGTKICPVSSIHGQFSGQQTCNADDPASSCRPFDSTRSGSVAGEAAACLLLEEESHALARGAKIWGRIYSGATSCVCDPNGKANPKQALVNAIGAALRRGGISPDAIGHYNAHGLGTKEADAAEAAAIHEVFGSHAASLPVTGLKGFTGNAGAASGLIEIASSLLSLDQGNIPFTLNTNAPDESLGLDIVTGAPRATSNKFFVNANFTECGQASAVVIEGA
ncbi:MAG: beta-ketoacyl synthase N-terminal-like domain-containing protein [Planctomycetaceae bacterium]